MIDVQHIAIRLIVVGLIPYTIRWQCTKGRKTTLEIRALFWSLQICSYSTRCQQWKIWLPLLHRLGGIVWEVIKEALKDKLQRN